MEFIEILSGLQENKFEAKLFRLKANLDNDFQLWFLRIRAALQSRDLATSFPDEAVNNIIYETMLVIIISVLVDRLLRAIQSRTTTRSS